MDRAEQCREALRQMQVLVEYGPQPRYRVTRRGNVYDDVLNVTVINTHAMGSIKQRCLVAQVIASRMNDEA